MSGSNFNRKEEEGMSIIQGLETTFNTVAEQYDRTRPTYVEELYEEIFRWKKIGPRSNVLEIGIGTGQATRPILETGCTLTAVELGDNMAAVCRRKFADYPNFSVVNMAFQDFEAPENTYDLIYSASAFHWIDPKIGYPKVLRMLKPGGVFARFANHPSRDQSRPGLHDAMQVWYSRYMPDNDFTPREYSKEDAEPRAELGGAFGFSGNEYYLYKRTRDFTSEQYTQLLGTYSDHIALGEEICREFFAKIREEIDRFGGVITIYDTIDLQLHKK